MSDDGVRIRDASAADATLLSELGASLFAQTFAAENRPEDMRDYLSGAFTPARMREELTDPGVRAWIAETAGGDACGYAVLRLRAAHDAVAGESAEIARLYVDRAGHGRGIAAALMARCVDAARESGATVVWLGVWQRNARAIAFYRKQGFRPVAEQTFVLGSDPQTDWVMARPLDAAAPPVAEQRA